MALMGSTPLFQIDAILSAPKIVLQPQSNEIYWLIMQCIRDCVESTKVGSFHVLCIAAYFKTSFVFIQCMTKCDLILTICLCFSNLCVGCMEAALNALRSMWVVRKSW